MKAVKHAWAVGLVVLFLGSGCATILSQRDQLVTVRTDPPGARIIIGPHVGLSPETFVIQKGKSYVIEATHGGQVRTVALTREFDPIGLINILFPPGFLVDALTGAMMIYDPDTYVIPFDPPQPAIPRRQGGAPRADD